MTAIHSLVRRTPLVVLAAEYMNTIDMMAVNHGFYLKVPDLTHSAQMIVSYCSFERDTAAAGETVSKSQR